MKYRTLAVITLLLLFQPLTPTPTIPPVSADEFAKGVESFNSLSQILATFTPLMLLTFVVFGIILYIVVSRNRGKEYQTIISEQTRQNERVYKVFEDQAEEAQKELAAKQQELIDLRTEQRKMMQDHKAEIQRITEDYRLENFERDKRNQETFAAVMDVLHSYTDKANQNAADIASVRQSVGRIATEGSPTLQKLTDETVKMSQALMNFIEENRKFRLVPTEELRNQADILAGLTIDVQLIKSGLEALHEKFKRRTDQLPKVTPEVSPS